MARWRLLWPWSCGPWDRGARGGGAGENTASIDQSGQQMGGSVPRTSSEGPRGDGRKWQGQRLQGLLGDLEGGLGLRGLGSPTLKLLESLSPAFNLSPPHALTPPAPPLPAGRLLTCFPLSPDTHAGTPASSLLPSFQLLEQSSPSSFLNFWSPLSSQNSLS